RRSRSAASKWTVASLAMAPGWIRASSKSSHLTTVRTQSSRRCCGSSSSAYLGPPRACPSDLRTRPLVSFGSSTQWAIGLSALLMHFADGVHHSVRLVELHVFRAVSRKDLPGIRRDLEPARLRLRDLMLVIQTLGIRFRHCGQMPDAMVARGQHADGPGTEGEAVLHEVIFVPGHLFHFREIRVVHRDLRLRDLEQLRV